jgi:hypothetical protein
MKYPELEAAMWQAHNSKLGVVIETNDPGTFRQRFYKILKANPEMKGLSAILPKTGNPNEVWLVKPVPETPDAQTQE